MVLKLSVVFRVSTVCMDSSKYNRRALRNAHAGKLHTTEATVISSWYVDRQVVSSTTQDSNTARKYPPQTATRRNLKPRTRPSAATPATQSSSRRAASWQVHARRHCTAPATHPASVRRRQLLDPGLVRQPVKREARPGQWPKNRQRDDWRAMGTVVRWGGVERDALCAGVCDVKTGRRYRGGT